MSAVGRFILAVVVGVMVEFSIVAAPCGNNSGQILEQARKLRLEGKTEEALALYKKYEGIDPTDQETQLSIGEIYLGKKDYAKAAKAFSNVLLDDPNNIKAAFYSGQANLKLGQTERARNAFSKVLDARPKNAQALLGMGAAELQAGNEFTANDYFKRALALEPNNKELSEAIELLRSENPGRDKTPRDQVPKPTKAAIKKMTDDPGSNESGAVSGQPTGGLPGVNFPGSIAPSAPYTVQTPTIWQQSQWPSMWQRTRPQSPLMRTR